MDRRDYSIDVLSVKLLDSRGPGARNVGKPEQEQPNAPNATHDEDQAECSDSRRKLTNQM